MDTGIDAPDADAYDVLRRSARVSSLESCLPLNLAPAVFELETDWGGNRVVGGCPRGGAVLEVVVAGPFVSFVRKAIKTRCNFVTLLAAYEKRCFGRSLSIAVVALACSAFVMDEVGRKSEKETALFKFELTVFGRPKRKQS